MSKRKGKKSTKVNVKDIAIKAILFALEGKINIKTNKNIEQKNSSEPKNEEKTVNIFDAILKSNFEMRCKIDLLSK